MMDKNIKVILFDLGQVLVNLEYEQSLRAFSELCDDDILQLWKTTDLQKIFDWFELGNLSVDEFYSELRKYLRKGTTDIQIKNAWNTLLGDVPDYKLETLLSLRSQYRIFLLSNTNQLHWEYSKEKHFKYKGHTVNDFFEKTFTSFELHMMKPDRHIYQYVLDDINIRPEEVFFIDDREDNCIGASQMGIKTYQAQPLEDWRYLFT